MAYPHAYPPLPLPPNSRCHRATTSPTTLLLPPLVIAGRADDDASDDPCLPPLYTAAPAEPCGGAARSAGRHTRIAYSGAGDAAAEPPPAPTGDHLPNVFRSGRLCRRGGEQDTRRTPLNRRSSEGRFRRSTAPRMEERGTDRRCCFTNQVGTGVAGAGKDGAAEAVAAAHCPPACWCPPSPLSHGGGEGVTKRVKSRSSRSRSWTKGFWPSFRTCRGGRCSSRAGRWWKSRPG